MKTSTQFLNPYNNIMSFQTFNLMSDTLYLCSHSITKSTSAILLWTTKTSETDIIIDHLDITE